MNTIHVRASGSYEIRIGRGLLKDSGSLSAQIKTPCRVMLVSDRTVWNLYGKAASESFAGAGFSVSSFVFPPGEAVKNMTTVNAILERLGEMGFDRGDMLAALGGGVSGDMCGFAAAIYLRGVDYIQVPTTLLAAVDSSVGGKTGVDLSCGKNMAGAFWQPRLVICDCETFSTLPPETYADGMAEVIKYGVIRDRELFESLESREMPDIEHIVARCCTIKKEIVEHDERESGERKLLNFGHTIGHAIETASDYSISHGSAVAIGMVAITRGAECFGAALPGTADRIAAVLEKFGLPVQTHISAQEICQGVRSDKKRLGGHISVAVPSRLGEAQLISLTMEELDAWIEAGMRL